MTIYIAIFSLLLIFSLVEFFNKSIPNYVYYSLALMIMLMLCFRYGQGSDYFGYWYIFVNSIFDGASFNLIDNGMHGEWGWRFICAIFNRYGISYQILIGIIAILDMLLLDRFIRIFCPKRVLVLLLSYPTLILIYYLSALREGLVISFFLGVMMSCLIEKKYFAYVMGILLCVCFHSAGIVLLLPLAIEFFEKNTKVMFCIFVLSFGCGAFIFISPLKGYIPYVGDVSIFAATERLVSFVLIMWISKPLYNKAGYEIYTKIVNIYALSPIVYVLLISSSITSSRMAAIFKVLEIAIWGILIKEGATRNVTIGYLYIILLSIALTIKTLTPATLEGSNMQMSLTDYHYVSVFSKEVTQETINNDEYYEYLRIYYPKLLEK